MPFLPVENTLEVTALYTQYASETSNVFHVMKPTAWAEADMLTVSGIFGQWFDERWKTCLPLTTQITGIRLTDLTSLASPTMEFSYTPPIAGARNSGEPGNVTYSVAKNVLERWRGGHGRLYVPGISNDAHSGDFMIASVAEDIQLALENLVTRIEGGNPADATLAVVRTTYTAGVAVSKRPIRQTGWHLTDLALDSQRRRLPGRGK